MTSRTFSASNFAVTDESTPPDIATTTERTMSVHLAFITRDLNTFAPIFYVKSRGSAIECAGPHQDGVGLVRTPLRWEIR